MAAQLTRHQRLARQSPPVDLSKPCDDSWVKGRHILITGGVGGFGAGFARRWAAAGASVVVGDINSQKGEEMVGILREELGNPNVHFVHCNVAGTPAWPRSAQHGRNAHTVQIGTRRSGSLRSRSSSRRTAASTRSLQMPA